MNAPMVEEAVVRLTVNGIGMHEWRCTPHDLEALVIGRLYIDGVINSPDQAHLIVTGTGEIEIEARVVQVGVLQQPATRALGIPGTEAFTELFRALFQEVDARYEHGGMHAAAATDGQQIVLQMEDVGRHNTIDKITGALLLRGLPPASFGLLTSSRVSGAIADKAARAGFAWLASRSLPTTLAVTAARTARMPIIGRAAGKGAFLYS